MPPEGPTGCPCTAALSLLRSFFISKCLFAAPRDQAHSGHRRNRRPRPCGVYRQVRHANIECMNIGHALMMPHRGRWGLL